jgi:hypothetical protein
LATCLTTVIDLPIRGMLCESPDPKRRQVAAIQKPLPKTTLVGGGCIELDGIGFLLGFLETTD